jgi:hypothetical protein
MNRNTVEFLSALLSAQRRRRRTRRGRRALGCLTQAVLVIRWFLDGTRIAQPARDNGIGGSTTYRYLHEGIDALTARAPDLHTALQQATDAGLTHVNEELVAEPLPLRGALDDARDVDERHHGGDQLLGSEDLVGQRNDTDVRQADDQ